MDIFNQIIGYLKTTLSQLTNTSAASVYQRMVVAFSSVVNTVLTEIKNTASLIEEYIEQNRFGSSQYYIKAARAFQYGDSLQFDEYYKPYYAQIDTSKQIVAQAALDILESTIKIGGQDYLIQTLTLKVARRDEFGQLAKLNSNQLQAFQVYMQNFLVPGIPISIKSLDANTIKFSSMVCTYSPEFDLSTIQSEVQAAMIAFRDQSSFNGTFYTNHLEQYVRSNVVGVIDFWLDGAQIKIDDEWQSFDQKVVMPAGYFNYEDDYKIDYVSGN